MCYFEHTCMSALRQFYLSTQHKLFYSIHLKINSYHYSVACFSIKAVTGQYMVIIIMALKLQSGTSAFIWLCRLFHETDNVSYKSALLRSSWHISQSSEKFKYGPGFQSNEHLQWLLCLNHNNPLHITQMGRWLCYCLKSQFTNKVFYVI